MVVLYLIIVACMLLAHVGPLAHANTGRADEPPTRETSANKTVAGNTATSEKNYALYTFSKIGRGGMSHGFNAGDHVLLEVTEAGPDNSNKVVFRITSRIPEPHSRIGRIGIDLGKYQNIFA